MGEGGWIRRRNRHPAPLIASLIHHSTQKERTLCHLLHQLPHHASDARSTPHARRRRRGRRSWGPAPPQGMGMADAAAAAVLFLPPPLVEGEAAADAAAAAAAAPAVDGRGERDAGAAAAVCWVAWNVESSDAADAAFTLTTASDRVKCEEEPTHTTPLQCTAPRTHARRTHLA